MLGFFAPTKAGRRENFMLSYRSSKVGTLALIGCFCIFVQSFALAQEVEPREKANRKDLSYRPYSRNYIFFGVSGGYAGIVPNVNMPENGKDGYFLEGKASYSRYFRDFVIDVGGGFFYSSVSGNNTNNPQFPANIKVDVTTRAGFAEFAPRLRVTENLNVGPVGRLFFGPDVTFDELINARNQSMNVFSGGRIEYDSLGEGSHWRIGISVLTDVTVQSRQVWLAGIDVQFGVPFLGNANSESDEARARENERLKRAQLEEQERLDLLSQQESLRAQQEAESRAREREQMREAELTPAPAASVSPRVEAPKFAEAMSPEVVKIYLGEAVMRFRVGSAELRPTTRTTVNKLGTYLSRNPDAYRVVRVEGHTDITGSLALNDRLSAARALHVAKALENLGVSKKKISARGFGPRRPVDPARDKEAYTLNRRVEVWLDGVTNPEKVTRDLNRLTL